VKYLIVSLNQSSTLLDYITLHYLTSTLLTVQASTLLGLCK